MTDMAEDQVVAPAWEGAGVRLKRGRESQGLSLFDAARALRLSEKQIAALEADDYSKLPGRTFVRGFIRNYARLVQLDPEPLIAQLSLGNEDESHQIQAPSQKISFSEHQRKPWLKWLASSLAVVMLLSWGVLEWIGPEQPASRTTVKPPVPVPQPAPQPDASFSPSPAAAVSGAPDAPSANPPAPDSVVARLSRLTFSFSGRSWVEVRDRQGKIIHSQNHEAGSEQVVEGDAPFTLVIGSAPSVKVRYRGRLQDKDHELIVTDFIKGDVARLVVE